VARAGAPLALYSLLLPYEIPIWEDCLKFSDPIGIRFLESQLQFAHDPQRTYCGTMFPFLVLSRLPAI
jgi:hypothetical protein